LIGISSNIRRRRAVLIALGVGLFLAVGVGAWLVFADKERIEADRERRIALARELIESATAQVVSDPELALLLAREAERTWHSERSEETLRQALLSWSPGPPDILSELRGPQGAPRGVTFSPDGKWVIATYGDGAWVWETGTGLLVGKLAGQPAELISAVVSPNGNWIATLGSDGSAWVWNTGTWKVAGELPGSFGPITAAAFHPDETRLAFADTVLRMWDVDSDKVLDLQDSRDGEVWSLEYDHDGNRLLAVGANRLYVLDADGKRLLTIDTGDEHIWRALWTRDGRSILASTSGGLHAWDAATGEPLPELRGNFTLGDPHDMDLGRDGNWLVTLNAGDEVSMLNAQTGTKLLGIPTEPEEARKVAISPNGRDIAVAGDGVVRVYTCEVCIGVKDLLLLADKLLTRDLTCEERNHYLHTTEACPTVTP
jgi:WD40 repeat protein